MPAGVRGPGVSSAGGAEEAAEVAGRARGAGGEE